MQPLTPEPQGAGLGAPPFLGVVFYSATLWCDTGHTHIWRFCGVHKVPRIRADIHTMIISDEQALLAARYLRTSHPSRTGRMVAVSDDLLAAARAIVDDTPEMRDDRVSEARVHMGAGAFSSRAIASKMISRIISDSLR